VSRTPTTLISAVRLRRSRPPHPVDVWKLANGLRTAKPKTIPFGWYNALSHSTGPVQARPASVKATDTTAGAIPVTARRTTDGDRSGSDETAGKIEAECRVPPA